MPSCATTSSALLLSPSGTTPVGLPWVGAEMDVDPIDGYEWELYHVAEDPTQSNNIVRSGWIG